LRISHCESTFTALTGGPSGLVRYNSVFHSSDSHRAHTTGPLLPFTHTSPPFFSFRCNKPCSVCSSVVCIALYFIHVLF
uniref:Uncharacterized protein n=1 Tax=Colobus angolensis palliatus TaxID=336983 RepID=A0A2K5HR04_COLAP